MKVGSPHNPHDVPAAAPSTSRREHPAANVAVAPTSAAPDRIARGGARMSEAEYPQKLAASHRRVRRFRDRYDDQEFFAYLRGSKPGTTEPADSSTKPNLMKMLLHEAIPLSDRADAARALQTLLRHASTAGTPPATLRVAHDVVTSTLLAERLHALEAPCSWETAPQTAEAAVPPRADDRRDASAQASSASRKRPAEPASLANVFAHVPRRRRSAPASF